MKVSVGLLLMQITVVAVQLLSLFIDRIVRSARRLRDFLWTLVFGNCAITVCRDGRMIYANVVSRKADLLRWFDENTFRFGATPFSARGTLWCAGHDGDEVDALRVATALDDQAA